MELDSLKELWKDADEKAAPLPDHAAIMDMLNKSSRSPVAKMIRNVLIEATAIVVTFGTVAVYYFIAFEGMFNSVAWMYIISAAIFVIYYYRKWKLLREMQCVACQVKSNLQRQVKILENYVRFYLLAATAIVPLLFALLGVLFYYKFPNGAFSFFFPPMHKTASGALITWVSWVVSLAVITALIYAGNRWFINRLYSRHILKLKEILHQMEEE
ncbi:MAG: hypothetical protein ABUT20_02935 [Bacteroidota bacterium]